MKKTEQIRKNLYDLEYTKYLNYLNMLIIISATLIITGWFSPMVKQNKLYVTVIILSLASVGWIIIHEKLESIKNNLKDI